MLPNSAGVTQPTDISRAFVDQIHPMQDSQISSTPVEMTKFDEAPAPDNAPSPPRSSLPSPQSSAIADAPAVGREASLHDSTFHPATETSAPMPLANPSAEDSPESLISTQTYNLPRPKAVPGNGPSTEKPPPLPLESEIIGPILLITLLLTNGARHPYKIDEKYLKKRNVNVEDNNPANMSTYTLKELIWRDWREGTAEQNVPVLGSLRINFHIVEWEARPSSPSSIRLIYYGKLLDDKMRLHGKHWDIRRFDLKLIALLLECKFSVGPTAHVVHMTVKPQDVVDEEDAKMKTGGKDREGSERSHGCRCVIL